MSLRKYPEYRECGVGWIGKVPKHWDVVRLKSKMVLRTERATRRTNPIALENISSWSGAFVPTESQFEGDGVAFDAGDLLFGKLRPYLAKVFLAGQPGEAVGDFHVLRLSPCLNGRFAQLQMLSHSFVTIIDSSTFGSKMPRASWESLGNMPLIFPPLSEQVAIATFLDRETAKIDSVIAKQERLIALLEEKRQATVTHAVTRGLDPDVPTKDSGVEYLGKMPAHWLIRRVKQIVQPGTSISYGIVQPGEPLVDGVPFVQTSDMASGRFELEKLQRTTSEIAAAYPRSRLNGGEVILGIRASIGAAYVVPMHLAGSNLSRGIARIECGEEILAEYLVHVLRGGATGHYWGLSKQGSTFNEVSIETVCELALALPPKSEQVAICEFLTSELGKLTNLMVAAERAITLLKERRAALITAAVTGQIDVRKAVVPQASEQEAQAA